MNAKPIALPAVYARGGTSRAVIFKKADLPKDRAQWDHIFQSVLGSPDPESSQMDGLGGGITSLSKVAILSPSDRDDADVDYLFVQVEPKTGDLLFDANCGNISSVVGPFAVDEGWVTPDDAGNARVRIYNENSRKVIVSSFSICPKPDDLIEISGVAGRAAPILLRFEKPEGSMGPTAFPTEARVDRLELGNGRVIDATLFDANVPCAIVSALDVGISGNETTAQLQGNAAYLELVAEIRVASALKMKLCSTEHEAREIVKNVPDVVVVSAASDPAAAITARFVSCDRPHRSAPVTSSMALAAASRIPGTLPARVIREQTHEMVRIEHPTGSVDVIVELAEDGHVCATSTYRTARRIMQGQVLVPELQS
ncbi:PrpF domain-containing protein [Pseudomonas sichuanensis]|uniref:PrpF domain-containing protein n=1 Tax=Pseudomonas sichuanensis TaxID=2213015 RepID=UPI002ABAE206|nr:PrpF domain-containing protein [Pseudomonas sichuanensis]MDZ4019274.1 3-methylitaconate isomerase [Pseudomonas sichuanensis]